MPAHRQYIYICTGGEQAHEAAAYPPSGSSRFPRDELLVVLAVGQGARSDARAAAAALPPPPPPRPLAQVAEVSDGLQDFSAQLQADTSEVSRETRETVEQANVQLAHKLERVTEQLDAAQLGQSISTLGATVSEQAGRATPNPNSNPNPSPSRTPDPGSVAKSRRGARWATAGSTRAGWARRWSAWAAP